MELRHLSYFVAVAEELHFGRAAARLQIAQPPLSRQIRRIEEELGARLFERTKRRVTLTDAGRLFLQEAREILARAELALQRAKRASRGEVGHLSVGFVPWADFTNLFPALIRAFGDRYPDVRLEFHNLLTLALQPALEAARIDIGFFSSAAPPVNLASQTIVSDRLVVALPERHRLCAYRVVPLAALAEEPHIVVSRERLPPYYDLVISLCRRAGFTLQVRHETDHPQTTLALVAAAIGVSLVPSSAQSVKRPGVVYRPVRPSANVDVIAAWRRDDTSQVLQAFLGVMRDVVRGGAGRAEALRGQRSRPGIVNG